ncbi:MAG: sugar phosphate nucleotidyltransferase [Victivallales bacterium]|jgi:NDP-sugar pyrophosphorylase family protein/tRNA A-37 threonylcarbamoyl transferase component Bud32
MSKDYKVNAIILAAGIGTRLRPVSDFVPKPLMPVGGVPLLESIIMRMKQAGIAKIAVNTHHLAERIESFIRNSPYSGIVELFHENEILGTGGPLVNARNLLAESEYFVLYNGDILSDLDIGKVIEFHVASGKIATLVAIQGPENRVLVSPDSKNSGTIVDILGRLGKTCSSGSIMTYVGIAVFSRDIIKYLPEKPVNHSIISSILDAIADKPGSVGAYMPDTISWNDIGTVGKYFALISSPLKNEGQAAPARSSVKIIQIAEQGSNRKFYRISYPDSSRVVMLSSAEDQDFDRFIRIGSYLFQNGLGTPEIFNYDKVQHAVLMEDLGDETVHEVLKKENKADVYRKVIDWLVGFQKKSYALGDECRKEVDRVFDYPGIRWETEYFTENFLKRHLGADDAKCEALKPGFDMLANEALIQPQVLIHRDFQSQNIMIKDGKVRVVDFQGARQGPLAYDLMSLLKDAYVDIPQTFRKEMEDYYYEGLQATGVRELTFSKALFRKYAVVAGLQRNMQALGAFTFLSLVKGKRKYLDYIPGGVKNLIEGIEELESLPDRPFSLSKLLEILPTRNHSY